MIQYKLKIVLCYLLLKLHLLAAVLAVMSVIPGLVLQAVHLLPLELPHPTVVPNP